MAIAPTPQEVEMGRRQAALNKKRLAQRRQRRQEMLISQYGESVGRALFEYESATKENLTGAREAFALALVTVLETGTLQDKKRAFVAMFTYIDEHIAPVRELAKETADRVDLDNALF